MTARIFDLTGQVAVVTGGTKGIGRSAAYTLAQAGAQVVLSGRDQREADGVASDIACRTGQKVVSVQADVGQLGDIERLFAAVDMTFGKLDILVNNAGATNYTPAMELTEAEWDAVLDVNLKGLFFCAQAAARRMRANGGCIVNISSILGAVGDRNVLAYCASKGGVELVTRALALEWADLGINVNAIAPGYIRTNMNAHDLDTNPEFRLRAESRTPLGRVGRVEELAGALLLLSSRQASSYITGTTLIVDGGWTAQ